jgi:hypothetical protein
MEGYCGFSFKERHLLSTSSTVKEEGLSIGKPSARLHTIAERIPIARDTPKRTVKNVGCERPKCSNNTPL